MQDNEKTYIQQRKLLLSIPLHELYILCGTPLSASLQESLELRIERFTTLHGITQLKSLLEGLKERVAKKPVQKSKVRTWLAYTHTCSTCAHTRMYVRTYICTHPHIPTMYISLTQPNVLHTHMHSHTNTYVHAYALYSDMMTLYHSLYICIYLYYQRQPAFGELPLLCSPVKNKILTMAFQCQRFHPHKIMCEPCTEIGILSS